MCVKLGSHFCHSKIPTRIYDTYIRILNLLVETCFKSGHLNVFWFTQTKCTSYFTCRSDTYLSIWKQKNLTRRHSWLRHCATRRKVAGSIPDGVTGIFHWHNPSGRTMALELNQPLTEMSTRNISWGQRRPVRTADNLTTFMCQLSWNLGASNSWNLRACPDL